MEGSKNRLQQVLSFDYGILHILLFFLILTAFACNNEAEDDRFYPHEIFYAPNIAYGEHELQKLDVFYRGKRTGEPNWVARTDSSFPVALHIHGGGWLANSKANRMHDVIAYVQQGFNVVNMNYRLGPGTAPKAVEDVIRALKWIDEHAERYGFDRSRVVLIGTSAGGHLSLIGGLLNNHPELPWKTLSNDVTVKAVVNWYGITDIAAVESYLQTRDGGSNYARTWIGDTARIAEISRLFSPVNYATEEGGHPAILTIHGTEDTVVPFEQAERLHKLLDRAGRPHKLLSLDGGNHGGFKDKQYKKAYRTLFHFLENQGVLQP